MNELINPLLLSELKRIQLRTRRSINADVLGRYRSAFRGSGLIFSDIREYEPGDDVKYIHWKASARTGKVYVKSFEEDRQLTMIIALDVSRSTEFGGAKSKFRRELEFAALLTLLAASTQDAVGLLLFGASIHEYIRASKKRSHAQRVLLSLLKERPLDSGTDIRGALGFLRTELKRPAIIFLLSDFFAPPFEDDLRILSLRHDVISVLVEDGLDAELPSGGIVEFFDAESGKRLLLDTSHRGTRERFKVQHERRAGELAALFKRTGTDFMRIDEKPLASLATLMAQRTRRFRA